jgi:hypothetical protein
VKLSGLTVSRDCADKVNRYAKDCALTVHAAMTDIIEDWAAVEAEAQGVSVTRARRSKPRRDAEGILGCRRAPDGFHRITEEGGWSLTCRYCGKETKPCPVAPNGFHKGDRPHKGERSPCLYCDGLMPPWPPP